MNKSEWRFLPILTQSAAVGVALDEALLDSIDQGISPNTVRFYHFDPPAVICGYHQAIEDEVDLDKLKENGFDLTRRITGGGTLFVAPGQIGIAIVMNRDLVPPSPVKAIRWFADGVIKGLASLGIDAVFRPKNDITVNQRKLVGTGQAVRNRAVLFHAIVLIDFNIQTMLNVLKIPQIKFKSKENNKKSSLGWCFQSKFDINQRFTTIRKELNNIVDLQRIYQALRMGFEQQFEVSLKSNNLLPEEQKIHQKYIDRYQSEEWIFLRRLGGAKIKSHTEKTKGGLIRIKVALDNKLIKSIIIAGDFFVFPPRAIFDLEASLKWCSIDSKNIRKQVNNFFKDNEIEIPYLSWEELANIIIHAINSEEN